MALKSFITQKLFVIKTMIKKLTDWSVCNLNKFSDEIKYLREETYTKNCIIQTLLENQKNIQNMPDLRTADTNCNKFKSTNLFNLPIKSLSNIKPQSSNLITTSNSFDLLSGNTKNSYDPNNVISTEDNNAESYSNKRNKANNTSISTSDITERKTNCYSYSGWFYGQR